MGRGDTRVALLHHLPAPIQENASASAETGEKERATQVHSHHLERRRRISERHMCDVVVAEGGTFLRSDLPQLRFRAKNVGFSEFFAGLGHDEGF